MQDLIPSCGNIYSELHLLGKAVLFVMTKLVGRFHYFDANAGGYGVLS